MGFYRNFLYLCHAANKSPSVVADEIGISRSQVSRWKNGQSAQDSTLVRIAEYFNVSIEELKNDIPHLDEKNKPVSDGDELSDALEMLLHRPERRALLRATRNMPPEQVRRMAEFLETLNGDSND